MNFASPVWLYGLVAVPITGIIFLLRKHGTDRFLADYRLNRVRHGLPLDRRFFRSFFLLVALSGIMLSLGSPRFGVALEQGERQGRDIYLVVDVSRSMDAQDLKPSRLDVTRQLIYDLLAQLKNDRVGVVVFAGDAFVLCPLTTDYDAVTLFVEAIDTDMTSAFGTNLGLALSLAIGSFQEESRGYRTVIVFSDGEDFEGEVDHAVRAAENAQAMIFTVGIGSVEGAPIPERNDNGDVAGYKKDDDGETVVSRLNPAMLEEIADRTGGGFFHATDNRVASDMAERINRLSGRRLEEKGLVRLKDRYQLPLGLSLLGLAGFLLL